MWAASKSVRSTDQRTTGPWLSLQSGMKAAFSNLNGNGQSFDNGGSLNTRKLTFFSAWSVIRTLRVRDHHLMSFRQCHNASAEVIDRRWSLTPCSLSSVLSLALRTDTTHHCMTVGLRWTTYCYVAGRQTSSPPPSRGRSAENLLLPLTLTPRVIQVPAHLVHCSVVVSVTVLLDDRA